MVRTLTGTSQRTEPAGQLRLLRGSYGSCGAWKRKMGSATQAGLPPYAVCPLSNQASQSGAETGGQSVTCALK
jgi:hypothetical protein